MRGEDAQIEAGLRLMTRIDADILVLGGIDYDHDRLALNALADRIGGYPYRFSKAPNRGVATGFDLNRDGRLGGPDDALGYGDFRGAEGLAVLSRFPLIEEEVLDETALEWRMLPGNIAPKGTMEIERVSSTAHWRLPFELPGGTEFSVVVWHATPPVFDGPEDRNGRRNHDEITLGLRMIDSARRPVIVAALANLDPVDGDGRKPAIHQLIGHRRLQDARPASAGGRRASTEDGGVNVLHRGDPENDTTDWPDGADRPGNLRTDFVLPDVTFQIDRAGVLWPEENSAARDDVLAASRHRIIWMDLTLDQPD